jgi:hypothetical protein
MAIKRLEPSRVSSATVELLGLDPASVEMTSTEAIAASVRRAASFLCPTTPRALGRAVVEVLSGLPGFSASEASERVEEVVELLVLYGDLLELPIEAAGSRRRHIFLGPPSFVPRSASCLLVGIRPEGAPIVGDEFIGGIEYRGHARLIKTDDSAPIDEVLTAEGLVELRAEHWLSAPRQVSAQELVDDYVRRLSAAGPVRDLEGVRVIDPRADPTFYRGRWRELGSRDEGRFVARRPQAFGADLWCFADVVGGRVARLIDLPIESALARGSDEAWRLQAALDALGDRPQVVRLRRLPDLGTVMLALLSPIPSWSQRRLDAVATPRRSRGALLSYALTPDQIDDEVQFLKSMMWVTVQQASDEASNGR